MSHRRVERGPDCRSASSPRGTSSYTWDEPSTASLQCGSCGDEKGGPNLPTRRRSFSSSPGGSLPRGPHQIRTWRFPPSGSSADVARGSRATTVRSCGDMIRRRRSAGHGSLRTITPTRAAFARPGPGGYLWVANYYSARNPLRLSSLVILGVVARMFRCATRSSCWCT